MASVCSVGRFASVWSTIFQCTTTRAKSHQSDKKVNRKSLVASLSGKLIGSINSVDSKSYWITDLWLLFPCLIRENWYQTEHHKQTRGFACWDIIQKLIFETCWQCHTRFCRYTGKWYRKMPGVRHNPSQWLDYWQLDYLHIIAGGHTTSIFGIIGLDVRHNYSLPCE